MLSKRILSALVAVPILLLILIYAGHFITFLLFFAVALIATTEYNLMAFPDEPVTRRFLLFVSGGLFAAWGLAIVFNATTAIFPFALWAALFLVFLYFLFVTGDMESVARRVATGFFGVIYADLLIIYLIALHNIERGWAFLVMLLAIVWLNDTGGYFAGRFLGKHKFYELISPKKTWEGSIGGVVLGMVGAFVADVAMGLHIAWWHLLLLAFFTGYVGQIGDLCESLLKRSFGIKDSGQLIPGHGGILDRIDALIFAAPFFYYYVTIIVL